MFKEYIVAGHQASPTNQQNRFGMDLMLVASYTRNPTNGYVSLVGAGINGSVYMTESEFEEFKENLKTANRLKRVYE